MSDTPLHIVCVHCLTTNRVPVVRLADDPVCGKCGRALLDGAVIDLSDANFDTVTARTEVPVLVDFWAPWCGPCRTMAPQFERAARDLKGRALLAKVNSDQSPQLSQRFGIRSIPTLLKLSQGQEVGRQTGVLQAAQIVAYAR